MPQQVKFQQTTRDGMIIEMGRCNRRIHVIGRSLDWTEFMNIMVAGNDHQTAGMLPRGTFYPCTAIRQTLNLRIMGSDFPRIEILLYKAVCSFIRQCTNGSGFEYLPLAKEFFRIGMGSLLIVAGEVQVDIRFLIPFEPKEGLERNIMSILIQFMSTNRTVLIGHITAACFFHSIGFYCFRFEIRVFAVGTDIMRRQRVYLRNTSHIRRKGRPYGTTGTNQIPVFYGFPYQFLGNDIQHCITIADDRVQFCFQSFLYDFRQRITINGNSLIHTDLSQFVIRPFNFGRKCFIGDRFDLFHHIRNEVCIRNDNFFCLFFTQIVKFLQHFFCGTEIQRRLIIGIRKAFCCHNDTTECRVLRIDKMHVTGADNRLVMLICQRHDTFVDFDNILHGMNIFHPWRIDHEFIIAQRLNFQIIIEIHQFFNDLFRLVLQNRSVQFTGFTGTAKDQTIAMLDQFTFRNSGSAMEIIQMGQRNQFI